MNGLTVKNNTQGHRVIELHYSADPVKAKKEWVTNQSNKYLGGINSLAWRREIEIDFGAGSGELVFPEFFESENKIVCDPFNVPETFNLFGGLDWGTRNPTSFHVYAENPEHKFYSVWELYVEGKTVPEVASAIKRCPYYDRLVWIAADPTMWTENQSRKDGFTSVAEMMSTQEEVGEFMIDKLMPAHGRSDADGINRIKSLWLSNDIKFYIVKTCPKQIEELRNLRYPERREFTNETEKILDKNNHSWDDFKYFILSHPYGKNLIEPVKHGTIKYINKVTEMAETLANQTGQPLQEVFNDLYGQHIG